MFWHADQEEFYAVRAGLAPDLVGPGSDFV